MENIINTNPRLFKSKNKYFAINFIFKLFTLLLNFNFIITDNCIISNRTIITSQWLNNIICLGDDNFRYVNFATYSNGSMIVEATAIPDSPKRMFYGVQRDGEPLFSNGQYHTTVEISGQMESNNSRYEGEIFIVPINGKEYVFSIGKGNNKFAELLDLNNCETKSQLLATTFLSASKIISILNYPTSFKNGDNYYFIFPFVDNDGNSNTFYVKKLFFSSTNIIANAPVVKSNFISSSCGKTTSCFVTNSSYIICLFNSECTYITTLRWFSFPYYRANITIGVFSQDLVTKKIFTLNDYMIDFSDNYNYFSKCIHLEGETGVFIYYKATRKNREVTFEAYPTILFKTFDGSSSLNNYLSISSISLSQLSFKNSSLLNDIVKISNTKLCFSSSSDSKETLYIALLNIFNKKQVTVRYYTINIFSNYKFKFMGDMRLHLYNNYVSFAFSFCRNSNCETRADSHYAGFMIFSYPNGTDYNLNVIKHLFSHNEQKIYNFEIDLKEKIRIDNNIFGLVYSDIEIKTINNCNNVNFYSSLNESINIEEGSKLSENENIKVSFDSYYSVECIISFIYIITEPDYNTYNSYCQRYTFGEDNEETSTTFNKGKDFYKSRVLYYSINIEENLETQCTDHNCELCLQNKKNFCITCKYNYTIYNNNDIKEKICHPSGLIETTIIYTTNLIQTTEIETTQLIEKTDIKMEETELKEPDTTQIIEDEALYIKDTRTIEIIENQDINELTTNNKEKDESENCSKEKILKNECEGGTMNNEQVGEVYDSIKENILTEDYNGENTVIQTENVIFQISTLEDQKNSNNPNISTIDLGECENILKKQYNISNEDSLIVLKTDIKSSDLSSTYVQYEIYEPNTLNQLNLSYCSNVKISVSVPVNLEDSAISLYESLSESGYNLFDSEDDFYTDICSTYTSSNGTDMTLADRKSEMLSATANISMCQTGCEFESYSSTTKKAKCNCDAQTNTTETDLSKINFSSSSLASSFISTLKNSNFLVLKCYKLALNLKNILKNIGRIIMTILYFFYIIIVLIYIVKDRIKINMFINEIIKNKTKLFRSSNNNNKNEYKI